MEIYVHVPFCVKKCNYCDFLSFPCRDPDEIHDYVRALQRELFLWVKEMENKDVSTIYIGGGTPSAIDASYIEDILDALRALFDVAEDAEITLEINPGTCDKDSLKTYKRSGVNRISLGLQSTDNLLLKKLGRIHTYEDFLRSYDDVKRAGFFNINVDVMSAIPGQDIFTYEDTLKKVVNLNPRHISSYGLIIEEGTLFYEKYHEDDEKRNRGDTPKYLPPEDVERKMYYLTGELLEAYGYERYEISNYAKKGFGSRHNTGYWTGEKYLGAGLGASSFTGVRRLKNISSLKEYIKAVNAAESIYDIPHDEDISLSHKDLMEEFMFLGLRMTGGVSEDDFFERFGKDIRAIYGDVLQRLKNMNLIAHYDRRIRLTDEGLDVSNYVFKEFLL